MGKNGTGKKEHTFNVAVIGRKKKGGCSQGSLPHQNLSPVKGSPTSPRLMLRSAYIWKLVLPHLSPVPSRHACMPLDHPTGPTTSTFYSELQRRRKQKDLKYRCLSETIYPNKQKGQLQARGLFLILVRHSSCQNKKNIELLNETQKDDTVWHLLSICMWTGLACLGWLKQCRSNLGVCTSERSPKPGQAGRQQQNPAKGQRLAKIQHAPPARSQCPHAPGIHSILVPPGVSTPCSAPGFFLADAGKMSPAWAGERPTSRLMRLIFLCKALHELQPLWDGLRLLSKTRRCRVRKITVQLNERLPSKTSSHTFHAGDTLLHGDAASAGCAAVIPCRDWLPFCWKTRLDSLLWPEDSCNERS